MDSTTVDGSTLTIIILFAFGLVVALLIRWLLGVYAKKIATRPNAAFLQVMVSAIRIPLYWSVIALSATLSIYVLNFEPAVQQFLYSLILTLLIVIWTLSLSVHLQGALQALAVNFEAKHRRGVSDAIPYVAGLCRAFLLLTAVYFLFLTWGINLTPLLAALSIVGAAMSFAARDSVGNVISGLSIFLSRPFKVGDQITIDEKHSGTVVETTLQLTKLKTPEKTIINIPNSMIVTKTLQNYNAINSYYRLGIPFNLPLSTDIADATDIMLKAAAKNTWILKKPLPRVRLKTPTDKHLRLELIVMLKKPTQANTVTSQILKATLPDLNKLTG